MICDNRLPPSFIVHSTFLTTQNMKLEFLGKEAYDNLPYKVNLTVHDYTIISLMLQSYIPQDNILQVNEFRKKGENLIMEGERLIRQGKDINDGEMLIKQGESFKMQGENLIMKNCKFNIKITISIARPVKREDNHISVLKGILIRPNASLLENSYTAILPEKQLSLEKIQAQLDTNSRMEDYPKLITRFYKELDEFYLSYK